MDDKIRLIDGNEVISKLKSHKDFIIESYGEFRNLPNSLKYRCDEIDSCIAEIINAPTFEMAFNGRWIYGENDDGQDGIFCSECKHFVPWAYEYYDKSDDLINDNPRCPHCGARMNVMKSALKKNM